MNSKAEKDKYFENLWEIAVTKGMTAGRECQPKAMTVVEHSEGTETHYHIPDGVCGFAWVNIKPANSPFCQWLKRTGRHDGTIAYRGGYNIWISDYGQSMARKEAHARAMAEALRRAGIQAFAQSRMD